MNDFYASVEKVSGLSAPKTPQALLALPCIEAGPALGAKLKAGIRTAAVDPSFKVKMALAEQIMREDRDILRVLAK